MTMERAPDGQQQGIQSIEVGFRVLLALEQGRGPLALSDVARRSDMHPSKVHRYLVSLMRVGLAARDVNTGFYDLGPAARHLGVEALRRTDPVSIASAYAVGLRDGTGHTVNVAVWGDAGPQIVRWDSGAHALPITVRVGSTFPLLDSAVGQVFLAHLPRSITTPTLRRQQRQSETRSMTPAEVADVEATVRERGFSWTTNQMIVGLAAIAAPVFGADESLELVMGMALPARLLGEADLERLVPRLREVTAAVSRDLGLRRDEVAGDG